MKIELASNTGRTIVEQVVESIAQLIDGQRLPPGRKLPSIRDFAEANGISKSSVVDAYDRLVAQGLLESRHKVGFFVAGRRRPFDLSEPNPAVDRDIDPMWLMRQSVQSDPRTLKPGYGWLPPEWLGEEGLRRGLRALARAPQAQLIDYGRPLGYAPLRAQLQRIFAERNIEAGPGQIMLVDSATQAIELVNRLLIQPGDAVFVDDPCYFNVLCNLRLHRAKVIGIPFRRNGPDTEIFAAEAARHRPRLYITNAALHNPTGATLSPAVAYRLLKTAEEHDITIVEDDVFADFEEEPPAPRLAALDQLNRVIYVSSSSKTLSSAMRVGYIAARPDLIEGLIDIKLATMISNNEVSAQLMHGLLTDGSYRKHAETLRNRLRAAGAQVRRSLAESGLELWTEPRGGLFLWVMLPEDKDSAVIAKRALAQDVSLAPGNAFSVSQTAARFLRFNVAQSLHQRIYDVLRREIDGRRRD